MPIYEYECNQCSQRVEVIQRISDPAAQCPKCEIEMRKLHSAPAIQFKGSGFYKTDYPSSSANANSKSESKGDSKSESKGDTKSESKSDAKGDSKSESKSGSGSSDSGSAPSTSKAPASAAPGKND